MYFDHIKDRSKKCYVSYINLPMYIPLPVCKLSNNPSKTEFTASKHESIYTPNWNDSAISITDVMDRRKALNYTISHKLHNNVHVTQH